MPDVRSLSAAVPALSLAALLACAGCATPPGQAPAAAPESGAARLQRIRHLVVIYAENHSFDNLYGLFPGADGIANATAAQKTQLDHDGQPLPELIVFGPDGQPDARFPRLPNGPFRIDAPPVGKRHDELVPSPIHAFWHNQEQINGGQNNLFAAMSTVGGWTMGYYDTSSLQLWQWAREYTLADRFFMGAFGGSYLNHQYLICACAPRHDSAPASMRVKLDADGRPTDEDAFVEDHGTPERLPLTLVVERRSDGLLVGDLYLHGEDAWAQREVADRAAGVQAEIGYTLDPDHGGRGYATEAMHAVLGVAFSKLGWKTAMSLIADDNLASQAVARKLGGAVERYIDINDRRCGVYRHVFPHHS